MHLEDGHKVVRCAGDAPLHRAKSLINIQFSWLLIALTIFALSFHLVLFKLYEETSKARYFSLMTKDEEEQEKIPAYDVESQSNNDKHGVSRSFVQMGHKLTEMDMER